MLILLPSFVSSFLSHVFAVFGFTHTAMVMLLLLPAFPCLLVGTACQVNISCCPWPYLPSRNMQDILSQLHQSFGIGSLWRWEKWAWAWLWGSMVLLKPEGEGRREGVERFFQMTSSCRTVIELCAPKAGLPSSINKFCKPSFYYRIPSWIISPWSGLPIAEIMIFFPNEKKLEMNLKSKILRRTDSEYSLLIHLLHTDAF